MSTTLDTRLSPQSAPCRTAGQEVRHQVRAIVGSLYPATSSAERRRSQRFPYPRLVKLTPVDPVTLAALDDSIVVAGKHISDSGLGFYHQQPLADRHMIASLENGDGKSFRFLIDLSWCRFTKLGWYQSGGRFIRAL